MGLFIVLVLIGVGVWYIRKHFKTPKFGSLCVTTLWFEDG